MSLLSLSWRTGPRVEWGGRTSFYGNLANISVIDDNEKSIDYYIGNDDQATAAALEDARSGLDEGLFNSDFVMNHLDEDEFASDWAESERDYFYEEVHRRPQDYIDDDPEGEEDEYTDEQIETAIEGQIDNLRTNISQNPFAYLTRQIGFTSEEAMDKLKPYINEDELLQDAIDEDGRGHFLNDWDGDEYSLGDLGIEVNSLPEDLVDFLGRRNVEKDEIYLYRD